MYKVLVCDDEKDIVSAISIYLTSDGYEVIPARNGLEALDIVKHNDVHLVLMDIMMPVMDGIEAMVESEKSLMCRSYCSLPKVRILTRYSGSRSEQTTM